MNRNIYQTPSSRLDTPYDVPAIKRKSGVFTLGAFLLAPLVTSFLTIVLGTLYHSATSYSYSGILSLNLGIEDGEVFIYFNCLLYAYLLIIGLPFHWMLGKFYKRAFFPYLFAGILTASFPLFLFDLLEEDPLFSFLVFGTQGAVCFVLFWYVAEHLPKRKTP